MSAVVKVRDVAEWLLANEDRVDGADAAEIARLLKEELGDEDDRRVTFECKVTYRVAAKTYDEALAIWADHGPEVNDGVTVHGTSRFTEVVA